MPPTILISELNIDFEMDFNPGVNVNAPIHAPTDQGALSSIVCNIRNQMTAPSTSNFVNYGSTFNTLAGVSVDGVAILNVNSANQVDPFYPPVGWTAERVDACLSHSQITGIYHYHMASGCALSPPVGNVSQCDQVPACAANITSYSLTTFPSWAQNMTVIGIAKDGHVIYGPYIAGVRTTSGFDICNGMFFDSIGNYGYFATTTYPYITGCFGPGNYPNTTPNCTTNPPTSYTMSKYALSFLNSTIPNASTVYRSKSCIVLLILLINVFV
jgi:hypothetical protein